MWAPLSIVAAIALSAAPKAPSNKTQLKIEVQPKSAVLFVDGKRVGTGGKKRTLNVTPGNHRIRVTNKGDEHQEMLAVKKGEVKVYSWAFEDDRQDRHSVAAKAEESKVEESAAPAAAPARAEPADEASLPGEPRISDGEQNEAALKDAFSPKR